jgi:hypothetical protein
MPRGSASVPERVLRAYIQYWSMAECSLCKDQCCSRKTWLILRIASFLNTDCILLSIALVCNLVSVSIHTVHKRFMQAVILQCWISGLGQYFLFLVSRFIVKPWRHSGANVTAPAARSVTKIAKERFMLRTGTVQSVRLFPDAGLRITAIGDADSVPAVRETQGSSHVAVSACRSGRKIADHQRCCED